VRLATALLTAMILAAPLASPLAQGQAAYVFWDPFINAAQANGTIIVETLFYRLSINSSTGVPTSFQVKDQDGTLYNANGHPPGIVLVYANDTGAVIVEWGSIELVDAGENYRLVVLSQPLNAPEGLKATLVFSSNYPFIDVIVEPAGEGLLYVGTVLNPELEWVMATSYYNATQFQASGANITGLTTFPGPIVSLAALGGANITDIAYLVALTPIPGYTTTTLAGAYNATQVNGTGTLYTLVYALGDGQGRIGVRVTIARYSAYALAVSGAYDAVASVYSRARDDLKSLIYFEKLVAALNETIANLRETVDKLREENANLSKALEEYKGCEATWKSEVEVLKQRCDTLESMLQSAGIRTVAAFVGGVVLGLIGGLYAVESRGRRR